MKKRLSMCLAAVLFSLLVPFSPLHAAETARIVHYSENDIITIQAKVRFSTLIVLPADQEILDYATGDKDFWIINGVHNLCYVHPAQPGIRSDLNLVTASGQVYTFLLTEISNQPNAEPDLKVVVVPNGDSNSSTLGTHPTYARASEVTAYKQEVETARTEAMRATQEAEARAQQEITRFREQYPAKLKFDYVYKSKATRPPFSVATIYHDDKFTYVESNAQEKPTIYEVKDGKFSLLNFDLVNGVYIIPKIIDRGYLVIGKAKVQFQRRTSST